MSSAVKPVKSNVATPVRAGLSFDGDHVNSSTIVVGMVNVFSLAFSFSVVKDHRAQLCSFGTAWLITLACRAYRACACPLCSCPLSSILQPACQVEQPACQGFRPAQTLVEAPRPRGKVTMARPGEIGRAHV